MIMPGGGIVMAFGGKDGTQSVVVQPGGSGRDLVDSSGSNLLVTIAALTLDSQLSSTREPPRRKEPDPYPGPGCYPRSECVCAPLVDGQVPSRDLRMLQ